MSELVKEIKREIEQITCHEHKHKIEINFNGGELTFHACCENLKNEVTETKNKVIRNYLNEGLKQALSKNLISLLHSS